jgi:hypothetical protein
MIVKSMSRKAPSFDQLLHYIAAEGRGAGEPLLHNLRANGRDLAAVNRAFMANAAFAPSRRNGIALYHEVLSLSGADTATAEMLYDLAAHYLALRAPQSLAYGLVHTDGTNPHIHLVISANLRGRAQKLRLPKANFAAIKRDLELYQQRRYPALTHSLVFTAGERPEKELQKAGEPPARGLAEHELGRRRRRQGHAAPRTKDYLARALSDALTVAATAAEFRSQLEQAGIEPYERGGRLAGVRYQGRKYRLSTLGLSDAMMERGERIWRTTPSRLRTLADLLTEKTRELFRRLGYGEQMLAVLDRAPASALAWPLQERLAALERINHDKRLRGRHRQLERAR